MMDVSKCRAEKAVQKDNQAAGDDARDRIGAVEGRKSRGSRGASAPSHSLAVPDGREADGDGRSIERSRGLEAVRGYDEGVDTISSTRLHQSKPSYQTSKAFPRSIGVSSRLLRWDRPGKTRFRLRLGQVERGERGTGNVRVINK